jgi:hypothetical protein
VHNEAQSGRPSVITEDLKDRVDTFLQTGDSLLMSFMKFSNMFRDLSSMRLSQVNSNIEKFVKANWKCGIKKMTKMLLKSGVNDWLIL